MNIDQIKAISPTTNTFKNGEKLGKSAKWDFVQKKEGVLYGQIKGSGSKSYQLKFHEDTATFGCSCPSMQFPCKHVVALLCFQVHQPDKIEAGDKLPVWVSEWLEKKKKRAEKETTKPVKKARTEAEILAQDLEKWAMINTIIPALEQWLQDLMKQGLLSLGQKEYSLFDTMSRRLVDAKIPGIANRVNHLGNLPFHLKPEEWLEDTRNLISKLFLFVKTAPNYEKLQTDLRLELQNYMGWRINKEELLEKAANLVEDTWLILNVQVGAVDQVHYQKAYIVGLESSKLGYILDFSFGGSFADSYTDGSQFKAKMVFYPGLLKERAIIKQKVNASSFDYKLKALPSLSSAVEYFQERKEAFPWADESLSLVEVNSIYEVDREWFMSDKEGKEIRVKPIEEVTFLEHKIWLLANGKPFTAALLDSNGQIQLLGAWVDNVYIY